MPSLAIRGGRPLRDKGWPSWPIYDERELKALEEVLKSRFWGGGVGKSGPKEREFEEKFANYHGCRYGVCVSNGTVALHVALLAAGVGPGDEVIVPALTFWATGSAVLMTGAIPVIVDVDPNTYCLAVEGVEDAITDRTKAIISVYNYGNAPDMDEIVRLAKENDLVLIEDCARAHGFIWRDKPVGSIGDMGCFSFQQGKFMTAGEGGIVITNNPMYAEICHAIKDCGRIRGGGVYRIGILKWLNWYNYRMTQFQAAILLVQLERLEEQLKIRQENSEYLSKRLEEVEGITPLRINPRLTRYQPWPYAFKYDASYFKGVPLERFIEALRAEGIPCSRTEPPLHIALVPPRDPKAYELYVRRNRGCPIAEKAYYEEAVELPQYLFLGTKEDMDDIVEAIIKIHKNIDELL